MWDYDGFVELLKKQEKKDLPTESSTSHIALAN